MEWRERAANFLRGRSMNYKWSDGVVTYVVLLRRRFLQLRIFELGFASRIYPYFNQSYVAWSLKAAPHLLSNTIIDTILVSYEHRLVHFLM